MNLLPQFTRFASAILLAFAVAASSAVELDG